MKTNITLEYEWKTVLTGYNQDKWREIPMEYNGKPGVYRWVIKDKKDKVDSLK